MIISFDVSPLYNDNQFRGVGIYTAKLLEELKKIPELKIAEFKHNEPIPPCDLVHYPYFDPFFLTMPLIKKYPTVVTVHDMIPFVFPGYFPRGIKGELKWQMQKMALKKSDAIITDSEASKNDIIKFTGITGRKVEVVYLGPSFLPEITNANKEALKLKYNLPANFLLYVGDINYNKNIPVLYKAVSKVKDISLVLVGGAFTNETLSEKKTLDSLEEKLGIKNRLIKTGKIEQQELAGLYSLAIAYIQPSLYEGFGLPVLDAMVAGCPVVASSTGSLPEITGNAGITIENPSSPDSLVMAIEKLLQGGDNIRESLIKKGFQQAQNFSWGKTAKETVEIYQQVNNDT